MQKQAAALADKDAAIAKLKKQLAQVESFMPATSAAAGTSGGDAAANGTAAPRQSAGADVPEAVVSAQLLRGFAGVRAEANEEWENLPVPDNYSEALEQILMLQVPLPPLFHSPRLLLPACVVR